MSQPPVPPVLQVQHYLIGWPDARMVGAGSYAVDVGPFDTEEQALATLEFHDLALRATLQPHVYDAVRYRLISVQLGYSDVAATGASYITMSTPDLDAVAVAGGFRDDEQALWFYGPCIDLITENLAASGDELFVTLAIDIAPADQVTGLDERRIWIRPFGTRWLERPGSPKPVIPKTAEG